MPVGQCWVLLNPTAGESSRTATLVEDGFGGAIIAATGQQAIVQTGRTRSVNWMVQHRMLHAVHSSLRV